MKKQITTVSLALLLLAGAQQAAGSVPLSINYTGELVETTSGTEQEMTDKNGSFFVRAYTSPTSTQPLWAREYTVILNKGKFNIEISETGGSDIGGALTTSLQAALQLQAVDPQSEALYIGVRPLEDLANMEILPRQRVVSVPFAMLANDVVAARRNFTVLNGLVSVKNLTVLQNAVFSNKVTIAATEGISEVQFASSPRFEKGMTNTQVGKKIQILKNATVEGAIMLNGGLTDMTLTSIAASTLGNGLSLAGTAAFNGGLTAKDGITVGAGGTTSIGGTITPLNSLSVASSGSVTVSNLTLPNAGSCFPTGTILDDFQTSYIVNATTQGAWFASKDCFVLASVSFNASGSEGNKITTKFYASPSATVGTGTFLAEVGMGTSSQADYYAMYRGTTVTSFFLKSGEYLTWSSENGTINLKLIWRTFTYSF